MKSITTNRGAPVARDPFQNLFRSLFGNDEGWFATREGNRAPAANISETDAAYEFEFELPGLAESDIQVDVHDRTLTVTAERKDRREGDDEQRKWHRVEHHYGRFARAISLPRDAATDNVDAVYQNGVLHVSVPKAPEAQSKRIVVRTAER